MKFRPTDTFHIEFDTESMPGKIIATEVQIRRIITSDPKKVFRVDLAVHPLFRHLVTYVENNK
jgi:hypothetical protein